MIFLQIRFFSTYLKEITKTNGQLKCYSVILILKIILLIIVLFDFYTQIYNNLLDIWVFHSWLK